MPMTRRSVLAATTLAGLLLVPVPGFGWQDLSPDYVRAQVERIADPKTAAADRRAATWALVSSGDAYFHFAGTPARCIKAGMKPIE